MPKRLSDETNRKERMLTGFYTENDPAFEAILDAMEGGSLVITQYQRRAPSGQKIQMKESFELAVMKPQNKTASCAPLAKITAVRKNRHPATTVM